VGGEGLVSKQPIIFPEQSARTPVKNNNFQERLFFQRNDYNEALK
jgi:hypothetical protein